MSCVCRLGTAPLSCSKRGWSNINILKPSGFLTYHQGEYSEILRGARFALSDLCGSQNKQRLLLCTSLTDWFL